MWANSEAQAAEIDAATTPMAAPAASTASERGVAKDMKRGGKGFFGASQEVDGVLGMTTDELNTALKEGQTLADIAEAKGVDVQKVVDALAARMKERLASKLEDGSLTQAQYDDQVAVLAERAAAQANGELKASGRRGKGFLGASEEVAGVLGMTTDELDAALKEGQTLADIAGTKGVDVQNIIDALAARIKERLASKLEDGSLTQAQYDEQAAMLTERATAQANGERPEGSRGFGRGHGGYRGPVESDQPESTSTSTPTSEPSAT